MSLVVEYELGCDALPLVSVAAAVPEARIDLQIGPTNGDRPTFSVAVTGDDETVAVVEDAFESAGFVGEYTLVSRDGDTRRYTVLPGTTMAEQLGGRLDDLDDLRALYERPIHVSRITATPDGWTQAGRFADRDAFDELRTFWQRNDVQFRLRRLTLDDEADSVDRGADDGLTDPQRAAIRTANEMGYFDIPRTASLDDVADELDISASSLSERLRRAQSHLVEAHVDRPADHRGPATTLEGPHH